MSDIIPAIESDVSSELKPKAITFRPSDELRQKLEASAKECNQSINRWLETHFENYFAGPRDDIFSVLTELREVVTMLKNTAPATESGTPRPIPIDPDALMADAAAQAKAGLQVARKKNTYVPESIAPTSSMVSPISAASKKTH